MTNSRWKRGLRLLGLAGLLIAVCAASFAKEETVGERFKKAIAKIEKDCASRKLDRGEVCGEVAKLKPADPLATEEGRFAHSIKIPNPLPANSGYKPGMTAEQYFDHLCKTEAGEFIYKTVENVEGLYMMRPRKEATDDELSHLYALEDPYGDITEGGAEGARALLVRSGGYVFLEERSPGTTSGLGYRRYVAQDSENSKKLIREDTNVVWSRYGYVWRGITRPHDRELGISGGELLILDIHSNEVLAMRRGFIRSGDVRNNLTGVWWLGGHACPKGKNGRTYFYTIDFVQEVLKPASITTVEKEGNPHATK